MTSEKKPGHWTRVACFVGVWACGNLAMVAAIGGHWSRWVFVGVGAVLTLIGVRS